MAFDAKKFLRSLGIKRYVASAIAVLIEVLRAIPGAAAAVGILEQINGWLGFAAVAHAAKARTLSTAKIAAASAALSFLIALAPFIYELQPLVPIAAKLASLLGAAAVGAKLKED